MTEAKQGSAFRGDCRRFLQQLAERAETGAREGGAAEGHAANCSSCRQRLAAARANVSLLRSLAEVPLEIPPQLTDPSFLESVHGRVVDRSCERVGSLLQDGLSKVSAPGDVVWQDDAREPDLTPVLQGLLPRRKAPGWLWGRIVASLPLDRAPRHPRPRWTAGLAAALLLASVALGMRFWPSETQENGTYPAIDIVWREASRELDPDLSPTALVRELGR